MFTGIVETLGMVKELTPSGTNLQIRMESALTAELRIDQSVSHNGVCLTVDGFTDGDYTITCIRETLEKTNLGRLKPGDRVNLERCMPVNGRLDGHIVQGHVDTTGKVQEINNLDGSFEIVVTYDHDELYTVSKGSITVNGVSLTVVRSEDGLFSIHVIPYTWEHTNLGTLQPGDTVNLEFDILGKYIAAYLHKIKASI